MPNPNELVVNRQALLKAITSSKGYGDALLKRANERQTELERVATAFYDATLKGANKVFQDGVLGADKSRKQLKVALPNGRNVTVEVGWKALSQPWRKDKSKRGHARYAGRNKSYGAGKFWLDTGQLRQEFGGWIPGRAIVLHSKPHIRFHINGRHTIEHVLRFKELPVRFLDAALRRALIEGAVAEGRVSEWQDMPITSHTRGVYRAFWAEAYRPTMRPLASRLGRAMQEQILKTLRRR